MKIQIGPYSLSRLEYETICKAREQGYLGGLRTFRMALPDNHNFEEVKSLYDDDLNWTKETNSNPKMLQVNLDTGEQKIVDMPKPGANRLKRLFE